MGTHFKMGPVIGDPNIRPETVINRVVRKIQEQFADRSPAEILAEMPPEDRDVWIGSLKESEAQLMEYDWNFWARPKQRTPPGNWKRWTIACGRGAGKMERCSSLLPVPSGWKRIDDIRVGDVVFDESGKLTNVTGVYPQGMQQMYRMHFSDSTFCDVGAEHLWTTWRHCDRKAFLRSAHEKDTSKFPSNWYAWRPLHATGRHLLSKEDINAVASLVAGGDSFRTAAGKIDVSRQSVARAIRAGESYFSVRDPELDIDGAGPRAWTTLQIIETLGYSNRGDLNHCIPVCGPLYGSPLNLPIDPYLLGYWLGDGCYDGYGITCGIDDRDYVTAVFRDFQPRWKPDKRNSGVGMLAMPGLSSVVKHLGMWRNKHVPQAMLRMSSEQRLALLQGLMDSDGCAAESGSRVEFCNTNKSISAGVEELARTLGQKPVSAESASYLYGVRKKDKTRVTWRPTIDVFRLMRKKDRVCFDKSQGLRSRHRMITNIEKIDKDYAVCISVDSPSSLYLTGAGMICTHNTKSGSEYVRHQIETGACRHMALIAANAKDLRRVIVEDAMGGRSGLMQVCPPWNMPTYSPSKMRLTWDNPNYKSYGASCSLYSAEEPQALRGPAHDGAWIDELCKFPQAQEVWDMLQFGLRIGNPRVVITTTPKPILLFLKILKSAMEETDPNSPYYEPDPLKRENVFTTGSTFENKANLSASFIQDILTEYEGTRLGRQELYAEVLADMPGALWTPKMIEDAYLKKDTELPILRHRVVGVDPQMSYVPGALTGIVVCGAASALRGNPIRGYVLADKSMSGKPKEWAKAVVDAYHSYDCHYVIAERNQGGELVSDNIHNVDPNVNVKLVTATKSKGERAIPVVGRYEQHRVFHHGSFQSLESEMVTFVPGDEDRKKSPNRVDALVYALDFLLVGGLRAGAGISITRRI